MKRINLLTFLVSVFFGVAAHAGEGVVFETGNFKSVLDKASKQKKLIFFDAYASWCGPCKWMVKNVFPQKDVADFFNSKFVNVKIDMEKGEGVELAKKYGVQAYPTFLFLDEKGEVVHRICGGMEGKDLIAEAQKAMDRTGTFSEVKNNFNKDKAGMAMDYFAACDRACVDFSTELNAYFAGLEPDKFTTEKNLELLFNYVEDVSNPAFKAMVKSPDAYYERAGKEKVNAKIQNTYDMAISIAIRKKDLKQKDVLLAEVAGFPEVSRYLTLSSQMAVAEQNNDMPVYLRTSSEFVNSYLSESPDALNHFAWNYYERTSEKNYLQTAEQWARKAVSIKNNYAFNDTHAAVLYKLGRKEEALAAANKAIALAKESGEDYKETSELIKKIEQLK